MATNDSEIQMGAIRAFLAVTNHLEGIADIASQEFRIWSGVVCQYNHAFIFELCLKFLWEFYHQKGCRHTHDLRSIYNELPVEDRENIRIMYNQHVSEAYRLARDGQSRHPTGKQSFQLADFDTFLESNKGIIVDFKYHPAFKGSTSPIGSVIWNDDKIFFVTKQQSSFSERLYSYVIERFNKNSPEGPLNRQSTEELDR